MALAPQRECLAIGSNSQSIWNLVDMLHTMKHFQCADSRDKIYGALALVDWVDTTAPVPHYGKDTFILAVEVLDSFLKGELTGEAVGKCVAVVEWAGQVRRLLGVSPKQEAMRKAIETRREHAKSLREEESPEPCSPRSADISWFGYRLEEFQPGTHTLSQSLFVVPKVKESQPYIELFDKTGTLLAYKPMNTRPGDWFITCPSINLGKLFSTDTDNMDKQNQGTLWGGTGLIIRGNPDNNQFKIIGQTFSMRTARSRLIIRPETFRSSVASRGLTSASLWIPEPDLFKVRWHPEDLLIFEWHNSTRLEKDEIIENVGTWLESRVCAFADSSSVTGPSSEAEMILKKDKSTEPLKSRSYTVLDFPSA